MRRRRVRRAGVVALGVLVSVSVSVSSPAEAADRVDATASTSAWFKPGVPFTWQFPDPSVLRVGSFTWAASTNQGGAHLPMSWTTQSNVWTARANHAPNPYNRDPWMNDALTTFSGAWPGRVRSASMTVRGYYSPVVGDFDGDGVDDIFWYS